MNILITGAGKGIGFECVKKLCDLPGHHVLALSRNTSKLELLKEELQASDSGVDTRLSIIQLDVVQGDFLHQFIPFLKTQGYVIDRLINNAGALIKKPFAQLTPEDYRTMMEVNFIAPIRIIQAVTPYLNKDSAHIVNIGSMGGFQGSSKFSGLSAYSTSKAALLNLTECLAEEWKLTNTKVNGLALGSVQTEMLSQAFPGFKAALTAEQMAAFVVDFTLNGNQFFNGKIIPVALGTP